jgi:hypothetical protein
MKSKLNINKLPKLMIASLIGISTLASQAYAGQVDNNGLKLRFDYPVVSGQVPKSAYGVMTTSSYNSVDAKNGIMETNPWEIMHPSTAHSQSSYTVWGNQSVETEIRGNITDTRDYSKLYGQRKYTFGADRSRYDSVSGHSGGESRQAIVDSFPMSMWLFNYPVKGIQRLGIMYDELARAAFPKFVQYGYGYNGQANLQNNVPDNKANNGRFSYDVTTTNNQKFNIKLANDHFVYLLGINPKGDGRVYTTYYSDTKMYEWKITYAGSTDPVIEYKPVYTQAEKNILPKFIRTGHSISEAGLNKNGLLNSDEDRVIGDHKKYNIYYEFKSGSVIKRIPAGACMPDAKFVSEVEDGVAKVYCDKPSGMQKEFLTSSFNKIPDTATSVYAWDPIGRSVLFYPARVSSYGIPLDASRALARISDKSAYNCLPGTVRAKWSSTEKRNLDLTCKTDPTTRAGIKDNKWHESEVGKDGVSLVGGGKIEINELTN